VNDVFGLGVDLALLGLRFHGDQGPMKNRKSTTAGPLAQPLRFERIRTGFDRADSYRTFSFGPPLEYGRTTKPPVRVVGWRGEQVGRYRHCHEDMKYWVCPPGSSQTRPVSVVYISHQAHCRRSQHKAHRKLLTRTWSGRLECPAKIGAKQSGRSRNDGYAEQEPSFHQRDSLA